ncbi:MAG: hypothetical protein NTY36_16105 [Deltaproteobacteria bacterium]|nr:hypothetical protein [Deltaproteobacteria bacterium]
MRKLLFLLVFLIIFTGEMKAHAWVFVPDNGDTGWQTYVYQTGPAGFTGTAGFVVSNVIDDSAYSELLLDNLSHGGGSLNRDFELGDYSGYALLGESCAEVTTTVTASSGEVYTATQGEYFSHQLCLGTGVGTETFQNASHQAGTTGCILETPISLPPESRFTFNWAFLAGDQSPWNDFALFYLKDTDGKIVFSEGLAQIGKPPAPVSPAILLLLEAEF